jgi:hypothetical protein
VAVYREDKLVKFYQNIIITILKY